MGVVKRIFLTGASGYLGSNILQSLVDSSFKVTILLRKTSNLKRINHLLNDVSCVFLEDFNIEKQFTKLSYDLVIHTAANYGRGSDSIEEILEPNLLLPLRLLKTSITTGVTYFINTDTSLPRDINTYALSKKQFNDWLQFYSNKIIIANIELEYFYGPGDDEWKFINSIIKKFLQRDKSIDFSAATQERDFVYIKDATDAYLSVIHKMNTLIGYTNFELGSGKAYKLKDIILSLQQMCHGEATELNFGALPTRDNEVMHSKAQIDLLKNLGWQLNYTLEQGLLKTIEQEKINNYGTN